MCIVCAGYVQGMKTNKFNACAGCAGVLRARAYERLQFLKMQCSRVYRLFYPAHPAQTAKYLRFNPAQALHRLCTDPAQLPNY